MPRASAILLLILAGCAAQPVNDERAVPVVWHRVNSEAEILVICKERGTVGYARSLNGCYRRENGVCHIYAPDPPMKDGQYVKGQWGTLGHEIKHCFDGRFH